MDSLCWCTGGNLLLSYGQCLVWAGSIDVSGAFYHPLLLQSPCGTSGSRDGDFPVMLRCHPGPPAAPRDLLLAKHNPAPLGATNPISAVAFAERGGGGSRRRPSRSTMPARSESPAIVISVIHPAVGADSHARGRSESVRPAAARTSSFHTLPPPACPFPLPTCPG